MCLGSDPLTPPLSRHSGPAPQKQFPSSECVGETRTGIIQCDALGTYTSYRKKQAGETELKLMACLAHIRRNFHEIVKTGPQAHAALLMRLIAKLYRIEEELREAKDGSALR